MKKIDLAAATLLLTFSLALGPHHTVFAQGGDAPIVIDFEADTEADTADQPESAGAAAPATADDPTPAGAPTKIQVEAILLRPTDAQNLPDDFFEIAPEELDEKLKDAEVLRLPEGFAQPGRALVIQEVKQETLPEGFHKLGAQFFDTGVSIFVYADFNEGNQAEINYHLRLEYKQLIEMSDLDETDVSKQLNLETIEVLQAGLVQSDTWQLVFTPGSKMSTELGLWIKFVPLEG